jgi:hypothetical protein
VYVGVTVASACSVALAGALPLRHYDPETGDSTGPSG